MSKKAAKSIADKKVLEIIDGKKSDAADRKLKREADVLPDFFVCGAARAGTTSLWHYLRQHPSIFMPDEKEPAYFSGLRDRYNWSQYAALFAAASQSAITGEASTNYLTSPDSAHRIQRVVPEARIIIILRDPVQRGHSLYRWMVEHGYEYASSFSVALRLEEQRIENGDFIKENSEYFYNYLYYRSGLYEKQVERYLKLFDKSKIMFVLFENLVNNTLDVVRRAYEFLNVNKEFTPEVTVKNESKSVWSPRFQFIIHQSIGPGLRKIHIPKHKKVTKLLDFINKKRTKNKIPKKIQQKLYKRYETSIRLTKGLTGIDLEKKWLN